ncbi:4'-phosphopantetheinyl transferase family protein [Marinigracilibium pacificum]|uniref:4'-phosphopantetheinyl transferase superfamily protein n=1 Tax=Marinigracilibium pacificum TaxID=2729599 RepID=A0A848IXH0_9BACT|nr:hypothetical protein [Marinigracilibium pacificum]NMM48997.1 hypothetical protein [Marinigracilibium pacificum]
MTNISVFSSSLDSLIHLYNEERIVRELSLRDKLTYEEYNGLVRDQFIAGRILLNNVLLTEGIKSTIKEIEYLPTGKILINGLSFNISHSGNFACIAYCKEDIELGVDMEVFDRADQEVESLYNLNPGLFNVYNSKKENLINWTIAESIVKCGNFGLDEIELIRKIEPNIYSVDNELFRLESWIFDEFVISCSVNITSLVSSELYFDLK